MRPRISLSCHGDQADPELVFKRISTSVTPVAMGKDNVQTASKVIAAIQPEIKNIKAASSSNKVVKKALEKVGAPWPKGLHDESWIEHAKLPDSFWTDAGRQD